MCKLLALLALLFSFPALGQVPKATILSEISSSSAAGLLGGTILNNIVNSYAEYPTGGTTGQALVKNSNSNFDVRWASIPFVDYQTNVNNGFGQGIFLYEPLGPLPPGAAGFAVVSFLSSAAESARLRHAGHFLRDTTNITAPIDTTSNGAIKLESVVGPNNGQGENTVDIRTTNNAPAGTGNSSMYITTLNNQPAAALWGTVIDIRDFTATPTQGLIGQEIGMTATGEDTHNARSMLWLIGKSTDGIFARIHEGIKFATAGGTRFDTGISFGGQYGVAMMDTTIASGFDGIPVVLALADNYQITFGTTKTRRLYSDGSTSLFYDAGGAHMFTVQDAGNITSVGWNRAGNATQTLALLPTCNAAAKGGRAWIADGATATPTFGAILIGGGANANAAFCNGTVWTAG